MKPKLILGLTGLLFATSNLQLSTAFTQVTGFTSRGRLTSGGSAANGRHALQFALFGTPTGGSPWAMF